MKRKFIIPVLILFLWSCEKSINPEILKFYGDAYEDIGYSIDKTANGYLIAGQYTEITRDSAGTRIMASEKKMTVISTDFDGIQTGKEILGKNLSSSGAKIVAFDDGTAVAVGYAVGASTQKKDIYIVKLTENGEGYTEKTISMKGNQYATDIIRVQKRINDVLINDGFLVLGSTDVKRGSTDYTGNAEGQKDILLLRLKENLDTIRTTPAGYIGNDEGIELKPEQNGGYIVVGTTDRSDKPASEQGGKNIFIMKANQDISATDIRIMGGLESESAAGFEVVDDGYLIAGTIGSEGALQSGYIWNVPKDIFGSVSEHRIILDPSSKSFSLNAICRYKTNSFLMAGQYGPGSSGSMLIFAADAGGNFIEGKVKIAGGAGNQVAYDVISDGDDIIAVGKNSYENNSMITLLKFRF